MLQYQHRKFKHVVDVPEPSDIEAAGAEESARLFALGTQEGRQRADIVAQRSKEQADRQRRTLVLMEKSRKWQRVTAPATHIVANPPARVVDPAAGEPVPLEPKPVKRIPARADD